VRGLIEAHGQSLDITGIPAMVEVLSQGRTLKLLESDLPLPMRIMFNATLGGRAALVAPVRIGGHTFGLLGLVWSEPREQFKDHEVSAGRRHRRSNRDGARARSPFRGK